MTAIGVLQLVIYMGVLLLLVKPLGCYMANVYDGKSVVNRVFGPVERVIYRLFGTREGVEMNWKTYTFAFLFFMHWGC